MGIIIGVFTGAIGMGYFIYGKKQARFVFMLCGVGLMGYTYFIPNMIISVVVGLLLAAIPFLVNE